MKNGPRIGVARPSPDPKANDDMTNETRGLAHSRLVRRTQTDPTIELNHAKSGSCPSAPVGGAALAAAAAATTGSTLGIGCGVGMPQFSKVSGAELGEAIKKCVEDPAIVAAAEAAGGKLREENGCENFTTSFDAWWSSEFESGNWLEKHKALIEQSKAAAAASAQSSCVVQ